MILHKHLFPISEDFIASGHKLLSYFMLGKFMNFSAVSHCGLYNGLISCEIWVSNPLPGSDLE